MVSMSVGMVAINGSAKPLLVINEDNDHYFKAYPPTKEALEAYVDGMTASGRVTHIVFCACGQRASFDSKTWEPIWKALDECDANGKPYDNKWIRCAKKLHDEGIDPYAVWIGECRKRGVEAWVSIRMNDQHFADITNYFRNTTFCKTRRDLWVEQNPTNWQGHALDYAKREVRDYTFSQIREMIGRWDADGIELDWMRAPPHFREGEERANAGLLTAFMREVRAETERRGTSRGRKYGLAVRTPPNLVAAQDAGLDVPTWLREGLVDAIVPSNLFYPDPTIPVGEWTGLVKSANPAVRVYPCVNCFHHKTAQSIRDSAAEYADTAADGIYLFNAPYVGKRDTDGRKHAEDSFGLICREGLLLKRW